MDPRRRKPCVIPLPSTLSFIAPAALVALSGSLLAGCATPARPAAEAGAVPIAAAALTCTLPINCVSSAAVGGARPLRYSGSADEAMAALRRTLASFSEATVVAGGPLQLEAIFTTAIGFRDRVDFRIDERARRIDYRSQSTLGMFDFGKNRSRMEEFASRFEAATRN